MIIGAVNIHDLYAKRTRDEQASLKERGTSEASEELLFSILPLVVSHATKYHGLFDKKVPLDDLFQESCRIALLTISKWDPTRGTLSTFFGLTSKGLGKFCGRYGGLIVSPTNSRHPDFKYAMHLSASKVALKGMELAEDIVDNSMQEEIDRSESLEDLRQKVVDARLGGKNNHLMGLLAEGYNMKEIGELFGVTRERVRQLRNRAIERIRKSTT